LSMLLHYLGKLKNQKFCILMHVKHVSNVTFYHLSNRLLPNVFKMNVKVNTIQKYRHFAFSSFTVLNKLKECLIADLRYGPISDRSLLTLQLTSEESVSRYVSLQMVDILNIFVNTLLQTICIFMCFLVQVTSVHRVSFLLC